MLRQIHQTMMLHLRQMFSRHLQRIHIIVLRNFAKILLGVTPDELHVKPCNIMSHQNKTFRKIQKLCQNMRKRRCLRNHRICDSIHFRRSKWNLAARVHQRIKFIHYFATFHLQRRNLNHFIIVRRDSSRLKVKDDIVWCVFVDQSSFLCGHEYHYFLFILFRILSYPILKYNHQ